MKKFTFIFVVLTFVFASFNSFASKKDSIIDVSLTTGTTLKSWIAPTFKVVLKNVGTDTVLATDNVYFAFFLHNGSQWQLIGNSYPYNHVLAPNDTFSFIILCPFSIHSTQTVNVTIGFGVSMDNTSFTLIGKQFPLEPSGIADESKTINKVYYSNDNLNITFDSKVSTIANLLLTNLNGQVIDKRSMNISQGETQETLNLGTLPKGVYILNMQTSFGTDSKKFIVQ